jgi:hypothetical protein
MQPVAQEDLSSSDEMSSTLRPFPFSKTSRDTDGSNPPCSASQSAIFALSSVIPSIQLALAVVRQGGFAASIGLWFFLNGSRKAGAVHRESARFDHVAVCDDVDASGPP